MLYSNILEALGNTPLIKLNKMTDTRDAEVYVKFEGLNVGGSIKTRTAYSMVSAAQEAGLLNQGSVIVEPTSGNQGIGLAMVGAVLGYKVMIVLPDSVSEERRKLIEQYGAEVILVEDKGNIGECIANCLETAERIVRETANAFMPNQFTNINNPLIHERQTAVEILAQMDRPIDGFCAGIGTGGSISGIGKMLKETNPDTVIWAVEPENAAILSGGSIGTHLQMGIGDGLIPEVLNTKIYDDVFVVSDDDALSAAKALAKKEGILCGISSGSNVAAALKLARKLGPGKVVVTLLPDTGERYFSTPLFD